MLHCNATNRRVYSSPGFLKLCAHPRISFPYFEPLLLPPSCFPTVEPLFHSIRPLCAPKKGGNWGIPRGSESRFGKPSERVHWVCMPHGCVALHPNKIFRQQRGPVRYFRPFSWYLGAGSMFGRATSSPQRNPHPHVLCVMVRRTARCINHEDSACQRHSVGSQLRIIQGSVGDQLGVRSGFHPRRGTRTPEMGDECHK